MSKSLWLSFYLLFFFSFFSSLTSTLVFISGFLFFWFVHFLFRFISFTFLSTCYTFFQPLALVILLNTGYGLDTRLLGFLIQQWLDGVSMSILILTNTVIILPDDLSTSIYAPSTTNRTARLETHPIQLGIIYNIINGWPIIDIILIVVVIVVDVVVGVIINRNKAAHCLSQASRVVLPPMSITWNEGELIDI